MHHQFSAQCRAKLPSPFDGTVLTDWFPQSLNTGGLVSAPGTPSHSPTPQPGQIKLFSGVARDQMRFRVPLKRTGEGFVSSAVMSACLLTARSEGKVFHFRIQRSSIGAYFVSDKVSFATLGELVSYYQRNPRSLGVLLEEPCAQQVRQHQNTSF